MWLELGKHCPALFLAPTPPSKLCPLLSASCFKYIHAKMLSRTSVLSHVGRQAEWISYRRKYQQTLKHQGRPWLGYLQTLLSPQIHPTSCGKLLKLCKCCRKFLYSFTSPNANFWCVEARPRFQGASKKINICLNFSFQKTPSNSSWMLDCSTVG